MQQVVGRDAFLVAPVVVAPNVVINTVVEVVVFEMLELAAAGREKFFTAADVVVHRATNVEQEQHFDCVVALRAHFQVEPAGVARCSGNRAVQVKLFGRTLPGKATQPA